MNNDVNSFDKEIENAQDANSQTVNNGTQGNDNPTNETQNNVASVVDYQKKFSESSKEALRILEENKELKRQLELKDKVEQQYVAPQTTDNYYPGFEDLDEDAKNNLIAYTDTVTKRALAEINKNPAIAYATKQYNEQFFDSALQKTIQEYPELANSKDEFKGKYFNVNNVPQNIESILKDVAKIHLFDKAKEIGAKEQTEKQNRVDIERTTAGSKDPTVRRSLEDWQRMAQENPNLFRSLSKEFNDDMQSGKI
jgi:hypothetical protein